MNPEELALTMTSSAVERDDQGSGVDSAETVERAMAGDRAAFDELIICYQGRVLMTAWRLLGSKRTHRTPRKKFFCGCTGTCAALIRSAR